MLRAAGCGLRAAGCVLALRRGGVKLGWGKEADKAGSRLDGSGHAARGLLSALAASRGASAGAGGLSTD